MTTLASISEKISKFRSRYPDTLRYPLPWSIKDQVLSLLNLYTLSRLARELNIPVGTIHSWKKAKAKQGSEKMKSNAPSSIKTISPTSIIPLGTPSILLEALPAAGKFEFEMEGGRNRVKFRFDRNDEALMGLFLRAVVTVL